MKRRDLLVLASGVITPLAGCTTNDGVSGQPRDTPPSGAPQIDPPTSDEVEQTESLESGFDRVVDAVDDAGCDPTGATQCDDALQSAVEDGTLVRFPPGTYRFARSQRFHNAETLGFVGDGDVTFVPPEGFNDKLIWVEGTKALFSGIDIDLSADNTTAGLRFIMRSGFMIDDVEFLGRGRHSDDSVVNALALAVTDVSGRATVRNVVARQGSAIGHYKGGNGRVGIWIGDRHRGRIRIEDCHLEEFGNNGVYASRCYGVTNVIGGVFRNNNASSVRVGGQGNTIRGVTIEIDLDKYTGPNTRMETDYNTRAIVLEQGPYDKSGRVLIENCDIRMRNVDRSQGGIVAWPTGSGPRIEHCRIDTDVDWIPVIRGVAPGNHVAERDRAVIIKDTTISGRATNGSAIELRERPGSVIERTAIHQTGTGRDGIQLIASNPCTLVSTSITTSRFPIFAVNPGSESSQCLISFMGNIQLEATDSALGSVRSSDLDYPEPEIRPLIQVPNETKRYCLSRAILAEIDDPKGVGVVEISDGIVFWTHRSSIEMALDR